MRALGDAGRGLGGGVTGRGAEFVVRNVMVRAAVVPLRRPLATKVGDFLRWPLLLIDVSTERHRWNEDAVTHHQIEL